MGVATNAANILVKVAIAFGVVIVVLYCNFSVNFFPAGLTLGDTLLFLFVALGFGILYLFFLGVGFAMAFFIWQLRKWKSQKLLETSFFALAVLFPAGILALILISWGYREATGPLLGGSAMIFGLRPLAPGRSVRRRNGYKLAIFTLSAILPLVLGGTLFERLASKSMENAGLAGDRVSLIVDQDNLRAIQGVATQLKIPILGCQIDGANETIVHNFTVLWHGVGERSLVQLKKGNQEARIELKRDGVRLVRWKNKQIETCLSLQSDTFFDSYSSLPNRFGSQRLDKFKDDIASYDDLIVVGAEITGHADSMPVRARSKTNQILSEERACEVAKNLSSLIEGLPPKALRIEGLGTSHGSAKCEGRIGDSLKTCLAGDRRVTVKVRLTEKPRVSPASKSEDGGGAGNCLKLGAA